MLSTRTKLATQACVPPAQILILCKELIYYEVAAELLLMQKTFIICLSFLPLFIYCILFYYLFFMEVAVPI